MFFLMPNAKEQLWSLSLETIEFLIIFRFLSSGLIVFDTFAVFSFTVRKFMDNDHWNIGFHVFGVGFCFLSYITVGIMSLERLVVFHSPNFYLRNFVEFRVRRFVSTVWIVSAIVYYFTRYGACYIMFPDATMYDVLGRCNNVSFTLFGLTIMSVIVISLLCYAKIFMIIWSETRKSEKNSSMSLTSTARSIKQYKSTTVVFVYLLAVILTGLGYTLVMAQGLDSKPQRLFTDAVNTFNCLVDPCIYVLWFRECRLEMLKMFSVCLPRLSNNIEKMRMNVFEVVTVRQLSFMKRKNKTGHMCMPESVTIPNHSDTMIAWI